MVVRAVVLVRGRRVVHGGGRGVVRGVCVMAVVDCMVGVAVVVGGGRQPAGRAGACRPGGPSVGGGGREGVTGALAPSHYLRIFVLAVAEDTYGRTGL